MDRDEGVDEGVREGGEVRRGHLRGRGRPTQDSARHVRHQTERGPDHRGVLTDRERLRGRDATPEEGAQDPRLARHVVRRATREGAERGTAQHHLTALCAQVVGEVREATWELGELDDPSELRQRRGEPRLEWRARDGGLDLARGIAARVAAHRPFISRLGIPAAARIRFATALLCTSSGPS